MRCLVKKRSLVGKKKKKKPYLYKPQSFKVKSLLRDKREIQKKRPFPRQNKKWIVTRFLLH